MIYLHYNRKGIYFGLCVTMETDWSSGFLILFFCWKIRHYTCLFPYGKLYELQSIKTHFLTLWKLIFLANHTKSDWYAQIKKYEKIKLKIRKPRLTQQVIIYFVIFCGKINVSLQNLMTAAVSRWVRGSPFMRKVGCLNPSRDIPKSLKQVVTAPLPNARQ